MVTELLPSLTEVVEGGPQVPHPGFQPLLPPTDWLSALRGCYTI